MMRSKLKNLIEQCEKPKSTKLYMEYNAIFRKTVFFLEDAERLIEQDASKLESSDDDDANYFITKATANTLVSMQNRCGTSTQANMLKMLSGLKFQLKQVEKKVLANENAISLLQIASGTSFQEVEMHVNNLFSLPLDSEEDLMEVEKLINHSEEDRRNMVKILTLVGGKKLRQTITAMLKKLFSRNLAVMYSLKGRKKKKAFKNLELYKVVMVSVRGIHQNATDTEIDKDLGIVLATSGDWNGGRYVRVLNGDT